MTSSPAEGYDGPAYLSSHSADVVLSDIRPIKLKVEALNSINVLLDEFLHNVLRTAQSLTTDKLRAGLLGVLPTTLGKEALLEAEVELRAYWDRTKGRRAVEDDKDSFDLKWAFELLRLKCQAYSTLNESDDDPVAESLLEERMADTHLHPPSPALVAPASLYLTAILESMCEHILSNVGRVASRDSSRSYANSQDLFVALCEDDAIYGLFKSMKVYSQIEELSKTPKPRRSKSLSRNDKLSISMSRTSSPYQDKENGSRESNEQTTSSGSRTSLEKARSMKKFIPGARLSSDHTQSRSESVLSEEAQQTWAAYNQEASFDDDESLQEFDDLMRSTSTMKVSLTPDRLRTMEVHKQEKERRAPLSTPDSIPSTPSRAHGRRPSLRHVDSINEDEEPIAKHPQSNNHQSHTPSTPNAASTSGNRSRSQSNASPSRLLRKSSKSGLSTSPPPKVSPTPPVPMAQPWSSGPKGFGGGDPFPVKTRRKQVNRESLDLDAVMAGSDDEMVDEEPPKPIPSTPKRIAKVSATTRELMSFLDAGPPSTGPPGPGHYTTPPKAMGHYTPTSMNPPAVNPRAMNSTSSNAPKVSRAQRDLLDFLNEGPPDYMVNTAPTTISFAENEKPKNAGRLQRMMSKLSISNDKSRHGSDDTPRSLRRQPSQPTSILQSKASNTSLMNYTLPRPPPISPPASPAQDDLVTMDYSMSGVRARRPSVTPTPARTPPPKWEPSPSQTPAPTPAPPVRVPAHENGISSPPRSRPSANQNGYTRGGFDHAHTRPAHVVEKSTPPAPPVEKVHTNTPVEKVHNTRRDTITNGQRKAHPPVVAEVAPPPPPPPPATPPVPAPPTLTEAQDMQRLIAKATSAEECRLIVDMFLARAGVSAEPKTVDMDVPYPSPSPSDTLHDTSASEIALEQMLVEFMLGSEAAPDGPPLRKKKHSSRKLNKHIVTAPPTPTMVDDAVQKHTPVVEAVQ
ncbi:hypothetical protein BDZ89DRAFT_1012844 [Hymenopellis radicata]|nr:hypothetical protein BDZ89DRAFT_1012844 [Hymenopellis radicata]